MRVKRLYSRSRLSLMSAVIVVWACSPKRRPNPECDLIAGEHVGIDGPSENVSDFDS